MVKHNIVGEGISMRRILPSDIENMDEDEVIVVSRICINKRLMELKISSNPYDQQAAKILVHALSEARNHERKRSGSVANVRMTVGDLKKAFIPLKKLSINSLKTVSRKI